MSDLVRITDVAPRDGLQNESVIIPTPDKVRLIELLSLTGVDEVEVTSFVSPKWIPQLGDAEQVLKALVVRGREAKVTRRRVPEYSALVPNEKGFERATEFHRPEFPLKISVFTAASETFSRKNTNASIAETIDRFRAFLPKAFALGMRVRLYISCAVACPFEGPIAPDAVRRVADDLLRLVPAGSVESGAAEIDLGDTIGVAFPDDITRLLAAFRGSPAERSLVLHLHDTFGRAAACVRRGLDFGVRSFDASVAGLGGCPYAGTKERRGAGEHRHGNAGARRARCGPHVQHRRRPPLRSRGVRAADRRGGARGDGPMIHVERLTFGHARVAPMLLDRREKRNALTPDMLENIRKCADHLHTEHDRPRAVVLAGEGEAFCAGFDLSLCKDDPLAMAALLTKLSAAIRTLRRLPMPVVVAAHTAAIAGGCALLAGADFVVTNREAKLGYPVVRLGISPAVNAPMLRLCIGDGRTHERLLDPTLISGEEALRIGLAHECVDEPAQVRRARASPSPPSSRTSRRTPWRPPSAG